MSLKNILQSGVNPETGEYMSPEERKEAFKKLLGKSSGMRGEKVYSKKKPTDTESEDPNGALVKQHNFKVIEQLIQLKKIADKLKDTKQKRVRLETQFAYTQKKYKEKKLKDEEESRMESGRSSSGKNIFKSFASKAAAEVGGGLVGILGSLIKFAILDWISKPENKKQVETLTRVFMGLVKFFDFFISAMVGNTMDGFFKLFGGGSILERIFGFFQLSFGLFLFKFLGKRLLNPFQIIKDIGWIIKNSGKFLDFFKTLGSGKFSKSFEVLKKIFPKTLSIFKKSFGQTVKRLMLRIFGKGITKLIGPLASKATKVLLKPLAMGAKRIPIIGGLLSIPINMFLGDPIDKAIFKGIGSTLGAIAMGAIGSIVPVAGTAVGAVVGGLLGESLGSWLYDVVVPPLKGIFSKNQPQLNTGGIASGPDSGYPVTLHGTEAVIPIDQLKETVLSPYKEVAATLMGSTLAVMKSFGATGSLMGPVALQMFNPYIRVFGLATQTFSSNIGKGGSQYSRVGFTFEDDDEDEDGEKKSDSSSGGGSSGKRDSDGGLSATEGGISGSGIEKGNIIAKKLMSDLKISEAAAAGIVGNLLLESNLQPDNVEDGKGFEDGPINNIPVGTQRVGYGWGQWTNDRLERFRKFLKERNADNRPATDDDNYAYLINELTTTEKIKGHWKGYNGQMDIPQDDARKAATWFMMAWERPGVPHEDRRQVYAESIYKNIKKAQKGGTIKLSQGGELGSVTGEGRKGPETQGSTSSHVYLNRLNDTNIKKVSSNPGMCVTGSLDTMQSSGVPNPAATGNDVGNNPRGAAVQLIKSFGWKSIGGSTTTLKSPYGTVTAGIFSKSQYEKSVDSGIVPSGALIFQTRHSDWNGTSPGSSGFDMAIAQKKGKELWNGQSLGQWVYSNTQHIIALTPGGKQDDGKAFSDDQGNISSSGGTTGSKPEPPAMIGEDQLKYLYTVLTGKKSSEIPVSSNPESTSPLISRSDGGPTVPRVGDGAPSESKIEYRPEGYAKGGKIFLHWTGSNYTFKTKGFYHSIIQGDGSVYKAHPYDQRTGINHTWRRSGTGVGISVASMGGPDHNPWAVPPKDIQIESMAKEVANVAKSWGWTDKDITLKNVMTHAEAAKRKDGSTEHIDYGPGSGDKQTKWDWLQLKKGEPDWSGGDKIRAMVRGFMGGDSTVTSEGSGSDTSGDTSGGSASASGSESKPEPPPMIGEDQLKYLYTVLTGKQAKSTETETDSQSKITPPPSGSTSPSVSSGAKPTITPPSISSPAVTPKQSQQLPSMSKEFSMNQRMESVMPQQSSTFVMNNQTSISSAVINHQPLNKQKITETTNLYRL